MENVNRFQSLIILLMVAFGILIGQVSIVERYSQYMIMPSLIIMLFLVFIQIPLRDITKSFKNAKFTLTAVSINFIWTPCVVYVLGKLFLNNSPELLIGFVMLMVTPCTDWYLIFTARAKGNTALGASILVLNFILQLVLLPVYIFLIGSSSVQINAQSLAQGIVLSLVLPLICASICRNIFLKKVGSTYFEEKIIPMACDFQGYFLNIAIVAMFAYQGRILFKNPHILLKLLVPILLFFLINFMLGKFVGKKLNLTYEDNVALILTTLARNSPIALAIAAISFADKPLISLALIIGPLIELPVLYLVSNVLLKTKID